MPKRNYGSEDGRKELARLQKREQKVSAKRARASPAEHPDEAGGGEVARPQAWIRASAGAEG